MTIFVVVDSYGVLLDMFKTREVAEDYIKNGVNDSTNPKEIEIWEV